MMYAFKWRNDVEQWYLMFIHPDGRFFGDVVNHCRKYGFTIEGQMPDWPNVKSLFEGFADAASAVHPDVESPSPVKTACYGVVAQFDREKGQLLGSADIIYRYQEGDEKTELNARSFLQMIQSLEPVIRICDPYPLGTEEIPKH